MPLLGGLFSKKNKSSSRTKYDDNASPSLRSIAASDSNHSSPTLTSYVPLDNSLPSNPNARNLLHPDYALKSYSENAHAPAMSPSASSSGSYKLRLFGRNKSSLGRPQMLTVSTPDLNGDNFSTPPRPSYNHQSRSATVETDPTDRRLRPPPSRSAIFAAYGDPGSAFSTRSLPDEATYPGSDPSLSPPSPSPAPPSRRPSLFPWGGQKSSSSPKPTPNDTLTSSEPSDSPPDNSSFNLKSFRHIRPPSPPPTNGSNVSLSAPIPRPRGASVQSDTSQRISVAAFREAQARRSLAGSPSPSFRESSPAPAMPPSRAKTPDGSFGNGPRPTRSATSIPKSGHRRGSSMAVASTTEDDDSSAEDSENESVFRGGMNRHRPGNMKARSEHGHGSHPQSSFQKRPEPPLPQRSARSHIGHGSSPSSRPLTHFEVQADSNRVEMVPRSQSSLGLYGGLGDRASASTGSLTQSGVAQRSNALASANARSRDDRKITPTQASAQQQQPKNKPVIKVAQDDSETDSEDNAPLARLVPPRRPGSAMSSYSNANARSTGNVTTRSITSPKPLIDINELTSPKRSYTMPAETDAAAFTQGPTLLAQHKSPSTPYGSSHLVESPVSGSDDTHPLTRKAPPVKFLSPPPSPAKELKEFITSEVASRTNVVQQPVSWPSTRGDSSPEQRRDPLADRLTRVVKKSLTTPAPTSSSPPPVNPSVSLDVNPFPSTMSDSSSVRRSGDAPRVTIPRNPPPVRSRSGGDSPPDEDLLQLLGTAGIKFISRAGETPESSDSETSDSEASEQNKDRIAPIPIKARSPPPAFAVTSRPSFPANPDTRASSSKSPPRAEPAQTAYPSSRQRSSTLIASSTTSSFKPLKSSSSISPSSMAHTSNKSLSQLGGSPSANTQLKPERSTSLRPTPVRQRSTTMVTNGSSTQMSLVPKPFILPDRPFSNVRRNSPAGSSTGDSSSGRTPYTPQDGSDIVVQEEKEKERDEWSGGASGLGLKRGHVKRRSVSFEDDVKDLPSPSRSHFRDGAKTGSEDGRRPSIDEEREERRRERRRSEAKAAIDLGNVINGPGPLLEDDEDNVPINQTMNTRMSAFNPMMNMGSPMSMPMGFAGSPGAWGGNMGPSMLSPAQFMMPPPADPRMMAAHQQAMMYAKQAYQMAVAQQAMAAAADEWERGSTVGGFGSGGSAYGGSSVPQMMGSPYGMGMMNMNMMQGAWPSSASVYGGGGDQRFSSALSHTGGMMSSSRSDYGGGSRNTGNWDSSRSVYGESFGPPSDSRARKAGQTPSKSQLSNNGTRESGYFPPVPPLPASQNTNGRSSPDMRGNPRSRTTSTPARGVPSRRQPPPPSSWKASGV